MTNSEFYPDWIKAASRIEARSFSTRQRTLRRLRTGKIHRATLHVRRVRASASASVITTTNQYFDDDRRAENEAETQIRTAPPSEQGLRQLQMENNQLYHDVAQRSEEIRGISTQVVEIAQLQNELFDNILVQKDLIHQVDASAVASNDDLAAAIIQIRDAIRNTAQMRRWVIFFLLVMIFSLLFLDWYNV